MRGLLIAVAVILLLIVVGWISVSFTGDRASVTLEKEKIKEDTQELTDSVRVFSDKADERVDRIIEPDPAPQP